MSLSPSDAPLAARLRDVAGFDVTVTVELERRLETWIARAAAAWPSIEVAPLALVSFAAERSADEDALESLPAGDLLLAWGVAEGQAAAVRALRDAYVPRMTRLVERLAPPELAEEAVQRALARLVAEDPPGIAKYDGRGALRAFVEAVAVREARMLHRGESRRRRRDEMGVLVDRAIVVRDPELELEKRTYRDAFRGAFETAFAELEPRARNVLRYSFIDGLSIDAIGRLYGVGRSTAARWRADARDALFERTSALMRQKHGLSDSGWESVLRLVESQLDIDLDDP